jgi:hypothetical protein
MMKRIFCLLTLLFPFVFTSCTTKTQEERTGSKTETTDSSNDISEDRDSNEKLYKDFNGVWVNEKYLKHLLKHKSPKRSQEIGTATVLAFENGDVKINYGFHEGSNGALQKRDGDFYLKNESGSVDGLVWGKTGNELRYNKEVFRKQNIADSYKILEALLFKGKYKLDGKEIEFMENGEIKGWNEFDSYEPLADYYDEGLQVDQLKLIKIGQEPQQFGFKFTANKLNIYNLKCLEMDNENKVCAVVENGDLKYKLKKVE